jgi:CheY-like chemotaxis protein
VLIKKVRAHQSPAGTSVPAIALTAFARDEDRRRAVNAGFTMHVAKPVIPSELIAIIDRLCRERTS